jgi:hypothetical protein
MAHWLLRGRMAEHGDGHTRVEDEQRRPEEIRKADQVRGRADRIDRETHEPAKEIRRRETGK